MPSPVSPTAKPERVLKETGIARLLLHDYFVVNKLVYLSKSINKLLRGVCVVSFNLFQLPYMPVRIASTGSSLAAFHAGNKPANKPITDEMNSPIKIFFKLS